MRSPDLHNAAWKLSLAAMMLWTTLAPWARAAAPTVISRTAFQAEVARLQGVLAGCEVTPGACNSGSVGDDAVVGDPAHGGFEEHWRWLRETLDKARNAKGAGRHAMLRAASEQLGELAAESSAATSGLPTQEFNRAHNVAAKVLAQPEFQRDGGPTWWDRAKAWVVDSIEQLLFGVARVGAAAPWLGTLLEWAFFAGAAAGLLFLLLRNISRQRLRVALADTPLHSGAQNPDPEEWAARASHHAAAQQWRDAVHCIYWAAIASLETRRAWRRDPARTPREYLRLLQAGSAQQRGLRRLTQIFEGVWYGVRAADAPLYAESRAIYDAVYGGIHDALNDGIVSSDAAERSAGGTGGLASTGRGVA
jgi:hypothetical protein